MFDDLATRADRAMRTLSARRLAREAYEFAVANGLSGDPRGVRDALLHALEHRAGWSRASELQFVRTFGERKGSLAVPSPFDAEQLIQLIARVEVNVCLGDTDPGLLAHLQALAQRELELLLAESRSAQR